MACILFNHEQNLPHAKTAMGKTVLAFRKLSPISATEFVKSFLDNIKVLDLFTLNSEGEILSLSKAYKELVDSNKLLKPDLKQQVLENYENLLFTALGIKAESSIINSEDNTMQINDLPGEETDAKEGKILSYNIDAMYGSAKNVKQYMLDRFRIGIIEASVVNFEQGVRIKNDLDLNYQIADYKNRLFKRIVDYIKEVNAEINTDSSILDYIYSDDGIPNIINMDKIMKMADKIFYNMDKERLSDAFISKNILVKGEYKNKQFIDAYNAYVLLSPKNFDKTLSSLLGKDFIIKKVYPGETSVHNLKYKSKSANSYRKGWGGSELTNATNEIGNKSKLLVESTPLLDYNTGQLIGDKNLTIDQFMYTFNKLVDAEFIRKFRSSKSLQSNLINLKANPTGYLLKILNEVMSPKFVNNVFSPSDMNIFKSIYERMFNMNNPHSLYNIMKNDYMNSIANTNYDLLDMISGLVIRTNSAKYVQYSMDRDTKDLHSTELKQSNSTRKRLLREDDMRISNKLRSDRETFIKNYNIQLANNSTGDISFDLTVNGKTYTFTYINGNNVGTKLQIKNGSIALTVVLTLEEPDFVTLKNIYEKQAPNTISNTKLKLYIELIKFIDNLLNTGFLKGNLDLLFAIKNEYGRTDLQYLTENLMQIASNAALTNYMYDQYDNRTDQDLTLEDFLLTHKFYADLELKDFNKFFNKGSNSLNIIVNSTNYKNLDVLNKMVDAEQAVNGNIFKRVTKNASNNNVPNSRISNLANETRYYLRTRVEDNKNSSIKANLFATAAKTSNGSVVSNADNLLGVNIKTDAISRNNVKKAVPQFSEAEFTYSSIMFDFYNNLLSTNNYNTKFVQVQPTIYSDKNTIYMWKVGSKFKIISSSGKTYDLDLAKSKFDVINQAIKDTIGEQYISTYNKVFNDYREAYNTQDLITKYLPRLLDFGNQDIAKGDAKYGKKLINAYNSINDKYQKYQETIAFRQQENAEKIAELELRKLEVDTTDMMAAGDLLAIQDEINALMNYELENPFSQELSNDEIEALLSVTTIDDYDNLIDLSYERYTPVIDIENLHVNKQSRTYILNGVESKYTFVKPNHLLIYNATKLYKDNNIYNALMLREKKKFVRDIISNNISFPLKYQDGKINKILNEAISTFENDLFRSNWVNTNTLELIIAKTKDGTPITRTNPLIDVRDSEEIQLNPLLERYFLSDFLLSENLRIITTGFELAHPDKSSAGNELTMENAELEEASRGGAQSKRNVILPGTKLVSTTSSIMGPTLNIRVAIMPDIKASVYNINGVTDKIDAHDGSSNINSFHSRLENLALQDAAVGEDKKSIGHDFTDYGTAVLFKWAAFETYNERLRKSLLSDVNQYDLFRKMNNIPWEADLTTNLFGKPLALRDILNGNRIFYRNGNRHYEILELNKADAPNTYTRVTLEVKVDPISGTVTNIGERIEIPFVINTNIALFEAMGGVYSESLSEDGLSYSDASVDVVVGYMNNVGTYRGNGEYPTLENTFQPLKHAMIAYYANKSSIKVGPYHINKKSAWTDPNEPLKYMWVRNDGIGIQMDADHIVTDPEHESTITEFSQVISALEANGTAHNISKKAYRDLGKVALLAVGDVQAAIKEFIDSDYSPEGKSAIYEIVGTYIIKQLKTNGKDLGLSLSIIAKVKEEFAKRNKNHIADAFKIPFSSPSIFSMSLAAFTSAINKSAIKRKFPGMGAIMCPGYDMMTDFNIGGFHMSYDDVYNEASNEGLTPRQWLDKLLELIEKLEARTTDEIIPGDIVKVFNIDDKGNKIDTKIINIKTYDDYEETKKYTHFYPVVNRPRNLKPSLITWRKDGKLFNVFDLPQVKQAFLIRSAGKVDKKTDLLLLKQINLALEALHSGFMPVSEGGIQKFKGLDVVPIDAGTLHVEPAEVILSKIYADKFNLGPNDSLYDVVKHKEKFFEDKYKKYHTPRTSNYDICYTRGNGKHTYIVFEGSPVIKNLLQNNIEDSEEFVRVGDNLYKVDEDGNKVYRAGAYDKDDKLTMLVTSYNSIGTDSVEEVLVVKNPAEALTLYDSGEFDGIKIKPEAVKAKDSILKLIDLGVEEKVLDFIDIKAQYTPDIAFKDFALKLKSIEANKQAIYAKKKYTSFLKSLEFTVARIPAQTLQSFMKMKAVLFTSSDKNKVYVTHWQTWLQGSDYDIDKAYIMGYDFDENGIFVGWSPFFNYDILESLNLSEEIPTPNGNTYRYEDSPEALDITEYIKQLNAENIYDPTSLPIVIDLLNTIDEHEGTLLTYDSSLPQDLANFILNKINEHNLYMVIKFDAKGRVIKQKGQRKINKDNILPAFRNSVSSKISNIINDVRNAMAASTPINMDDPKAAAEQSELGKEAARITYTSPTSKSLMTVQNMSGKLVIGITAVGEKIFFAVSYYFNEAARRGDYSWIKNAIFLKAYESIQSVEINGKKITVESMRNIIANVNFETILEQKEVWKDLIRQIAENDKMPEGKVLRIIEELFGLLPDLSLVISGLLSASTDNAKELILDKINAGPALAGVYLHLIMLNYDFNDIAKFMISPTVLAIKDLTKTNIFDDYHDGLGDVVANAIRLLEEGPDLGNYLGNQNLTALYNKLKFDGVIENTVTLAKYKELIKERFKLDKDIDDIFPASDMAQYRFLEEYNFLRFKKLITINKIAELLKESGLSELDAESQAYDNFAKTFDSFKKIRKDAQETTKLGRVFGLNQGAKTDLAGKLEFMEFLENIMYDAEEDYTVDNLEAFVSSVKFNKSFLSDEDIINAYNNAKQHNIVRNFDIEKFLNPDNVDYKKATIDYFNCIKSVWNIFEFITNIPLYKALYDVLHLINTTDSNMSVKYALVKQLKKDLIKNGYNRRLGKDRIGGLISAIDEILITNWLANNPIQFTLPKDAEYFTPNGIRNKVKSDLETFNLGTDEGRATFKLWMEKTIVPQLKNGTVDGKKVISLRLNAFIQNLLMAEKDDSFTKDKIQYLKLPIDMLDDKTESVQANKARYENAFMNLTKVNLLGRPLTDWFFLYNLIVNEDKFGDNRLTSIFSRFVLESKDSIILDYLNSIGNNDYNKYIDMNSFSLEDVAVKMAPVVASNQEYRAKDPYIRVYDSMTERYVLKVRSGDVYSVVSDLTTEEQRDYNNYFVLKTPELSRKIRELSLSDKHSLDEIIGNIRNLMSRNTLNIDINCE